MPSYPKGKSGSPTKSPSRMTPGSGGVVRPRGATKHERSADKLGADLFSKHTSTKASKGY